MIVKRPFSFKGEIDRGNGWESFNGVVQRGWKVRLTKNQKSGMERRRLVYQTKENKKAYIVHSGGPWFEVRYGDKVEKVQGKENAEERKDEINNS